MRRPRTAIALLVAAAIAVSAGAVVAGKHKKKRKAKDAPPPAAVLEDPCIDGTEAKCVRRALDGFYAALALNEGGIAMHPARISYLGDSLVADDKIPQRLRELLGKRFGNGGPGFVTPANLLHARNNSVKRLVRSRWKVHHIAGHLPGDRLAGFAGCSAEGRGSVRLAPVARDVITADIYYLSQPGGGDLDVLLDGKKVSSIDTRARSKKAAFASVHSATPFKTIELKAHGKVRLFGASLEARRGVVVDNLGVTSATAHGWNKNRTDHWRGQLERRKSDLFIVWIGTNEAGWLAGKSLRGYQQVMEDLIAPARVANPTSSCLVISPLDQVEPRKSKLPARKSIAPMVEAQRRAAIAQGCAFWDLYAWMGGARSALSWRKEGWLAKDFIHPTSAGDQRIADALTAGLLDGYDRFDDAR